MKVVLWLVYLYFIFFEKFWLFVLDDGVFFVNVIEYFVSVMEMLVVSVKNVVLLVYYYYFGKLLDVYINDKFLNFRSEL